MGKASLALALAGTGVLVPAGTACSSGQTTASAAKCEAALVHGREVQAGPFTGTVLRRYDVVGGRFRLHVGEYRDRATGLTQKIGWTLPARYTAGAWLEVTGRRLHDGSPPRTFRQRFAEAFAAGAPGGRFFATIIAPPAPGYWRLAFRTADVTGSLRVLVHG